MAIGTPVPCIAAIQDASASTTRSLIASVDVPSGSTLIVSVGNGTSAAGRTVAGSGGPGGWSTDHSQAYAGAVNWNVSWLKTGQTSGVLTGGSLGTLTFSGAPSGVLIQAYYSQGDALVLDGHDGNGANVASAGWATPPVTPSAAIALALAACLIDANTSNTAPTTTPATVEIGDTLNTTHDWTMATEYRALSSIASTDVTGTWTASGGADRTTALVIYKAAGAAAASPPIRRRRNTVGLTIR